MALASVIPSAAIAQGLKDLPDLPGTVFFEQNEEYLAQVRDIPLACILSYMDTNGNNGIILMAGTSAFSNELAILGPSLSGKEMNDVRLIVTKAQGEMAFTDTFFELEVQRPDGSGTYRYTSVTDDADRKVNFAELKTATAVTIKTIQGEARSHTIPFSGALRDRAVDEMGKCLAKRGL